MAPTLDYYTILYLFFRLLPMLTAAVLTIAPLFNYNVRGLVYLVGLILTTAVVSVAGNSIDLPKSPIIPNDTCNAFALSSNQLYAKMPLDLSVFGFTFAYLLVSISTNNLVMMNIPTILFFPVAIGTTVWWLINNYCFTMESCLLALSISAGLGVAWGYVVKTQMPNHQYLYSKSNREACVRLSNNTYRCSNTDDNGNFL